MKRMIKYFRYAGATIRVFLRFGQDHYDFRNALQHTYIREWTDITQTRSYSTKLTIQQKGNLFEVIEESFSGEVSFNVKRYTCIYSWWSNGHLTTLGELIIYFFDTKRGLLFREDRCIEDDNNVTIYHLD